MCRICGRMVKCIFDSMPSRTPSSRPNRVHQQLRLGRPYHVLSRPSIRNDLGFSVKFSSQRPAIALPLRAKLHHATIQQAASPASQFQNTKAEIPPTMLQTNEETSLPSTTSLTTSLPGALKETPSQPHPLVLSSSLQDLLPKLALQTPHYIVAHIHRFPYLLTEGDTLRLPFHMKNVAPGDVLRFNRASIFGSRDYTLKAGTNNTESYDSKRTGEPNYIDERLFECRMRVLGLDSGPMMKKEKKKRRNRHRKVVHSKHKFTVLKVMQVRIKSLEELHREEATLLLEGKDKMD